jgi:hypothetical protein
MAYGIKVHFLDKKSKIQEGMIMSNINDPEYFVIISRRSHPKIMKIRINNLTHVSFDKSRGQFGTHSKEYDHFITLFMLAETVDLVFANRPDLEAFLLSISVILLDEFDG